MRVSRQWWRRSSLGPVGLCLAVLGACGSPAATPPEPDPRLCEQTYEFANSGCADISGRVLGSAGQPLAGISVGPRYYAHRQGFNSAYVETDADGRFRFRITRFSVPPPATGPDTLSLYVRAADPRSAGLNVPARVQDSVPVQVTLAPVGAVAPVTAIVVRLATP